MKIYMESYGCSANQAASEIMLGLLSNNSQITSRLEEAEVIIINSCIVKPPTEAKILFQIKKIVEKYPHKKLIVAGCMPEVYSAKIKKAAPNASMIGIHHLSEIETIAYDAVRGIQRVEIGHTTSPKLGFPRKRFNEKIGIVQIAQGCVSSCSYCIVKRVMGALISYPEELIIDEVKKCVLQGCKEIRLTAQDTTAYGLDRGTTLPSLLQSIAQFDGDFRVRVGMMNPATAYPLVDDLTEVFKQSKIYKFIHLPIQSGSNVVLSRMNRNYTVERFLEIVNRFRSVFPDISLSTDIIIGYPGETDEQFEESFNIIKKLRPDIVNVSKFGSRAQTPAAKLTPISSQTVKNRSRKLATLCHKIALEKNKKWVEREETVLIVGRGKKGGLEGRTSTYKPVIIDTQNFDLLGHLIKVNIIGAKHSCLLGNISKELIR
ncbi:MAG: tRNA (N(6)-L-threonylcarbamoyladenosine(37)-C(2))-methylthiotransferase [Promethearchaeota archaeon]